MEPEDYVSAYRKIIPPDLNRWAVFRHGTVYVLKEQNPDYPESNPRAEAIAFLKKATEELWLSQALPLA